MTMGSIYLESVLHLITWNALLLLTVVFPILYNDCQYDIRVKGHGNIYIIKVQIGKKFSA